MVINSSLCHVANSPFRRKLNWIKSSNVQGSPIFLLQFVKWNMQNKLIINRSPKTTHIPKVMNFMFDAKGINFTPVCWWLNAECLPYAMSWSRQHSCFAIENSLNIWNSCHHYCEFQIWMRRSGNWLIWKLATSCQMTLETWPLLTFTF